MEKKNLETLSANFLIFSKIKPLQKKIIYSQKFFANIHFITIQMKTM